MFERFERLSELFLRTGEPWERRFNGFESDQWISLKFFLECYAYEHQGRNASYGGAAGDTIDEFAEKPLANAAKDVWALFSKKLHGKGLNEPLNALCPKGTPFTHTYGSGTRSYTTKKQSVVEWASGLSKPLVAWSRDEMAAERSAEAHDALCNVAGIGPKIASLFLRDVAVLYSLAPKQHRELLQPIDVWVRHVVKTLDPSREDDPSCAQFIVNHANEPERANQGMWYFCARIADSSLYVVRQCLEGDLHDKRFLEAVKRHLSVLQAGGDAARDFRMEAGGQ